MSSTNFTFHENNRTFLPMEDFSGLAGYAVKMGTTAGDPAGSVRICTAAGLFVGVILEEGKVYNAADAVEVRTRPRQATVQTQGSARCIAQAAITRGAQVTVHTDGRFRTAVATETPVGVAETAAGAAGESFTLRLTGYRPAI